MPTKLWHVRSSIVTHYLPEMTTVYTSRDHTLPHTHMCDSFTQRDDKTHRIYIQYSRLRALFSRSYEVINVLLFLICPEFKAIHLRSRCLAGQTDLEYKTARPTYKHTNTTNRRRAIQSSSFEFIPREIHNLCRK